MMETDVVRERDALAGKLDKARAEIAQLRGAVAAAENRARQVAEFSAQMIGDACAEHRGKIRAMSADDFIAFMTAAHPACAFCARAQLAAVTQENTELLAKALAQSGSLIAREAEREQAIRERDEARAQCERQVSRAGVSHIVADREPLAPTEDQAERIAVRLMDAFCIPADDALSEVDDLWALFREMVLEAAAKECMGQAEEYTDSRDRQRKWTAEACAQRIRALKGTP